MATIDGNYILVESEDPSYNIDVTDQPVEDNIDLTDHVKRKARTMQITGFILGDDAGEKREAILYAMENASIVEYDGRNYFVGLISGFSTKHDNQTANGFSFSMSLKEIRIAEASYIETLPEVIRTQAAPIISSGRKETKESSSSAKSSTAQPGVQKVKFVAGSPFAD
jgi:hypothetical protein